jgi:hypothetical protein
MMQQTRRCPDGKGQDKLTCGEKQVSISVSKSISEIMFSNCYLFWLEVNLFAAGCVLYNTGWIVVFSSGKGWKLLKVLAPLLHEFL